MLFLTLATFSQTGGVQMVCRSLSKALCAIQDEHSRPFQMISLCDTPVNQVNHYIPAKAFKGFAYRRVKFCSYVLMRALTAETVVLSHINLMPVGWIIKYLKPATRLIVLAHGKEVWGKMPRWKRHFLNNKAEVWAVSRFTKKMLVVRHKIQPEKVQVLNNCLDPFFKVPVHFNKPSYLLERYGLKSHHQVLLSLTRMDSHEKDKGYDLVLDALPVLLETFPNTRYVMAGMVSASEALRLTLKIEALNIKPFVTISGFIREEEVTDHHLLANIFVLPSSKEGFGLVFLEAAACGSSIIAGNKDGSVDAVMDGALATLVDPGSRQEITNALKKHLKSDNNNEMNARQQELSTRQFSFTKYQDNIKALLTKTRSN